MANAMPRFQLHSRSGRRLVDVQPFTFALTAALVLAFVAGGLVAAVAVVLLLGGGLVALQSVAIATRGRGAPGLAARRGTRGVGSRRAIRSGKPVSGGPSPSLMPWKSWSDP